MSGGATNRINYHTANILFEKTKKKLKVQIKIDTGMNRIGINTKEAINFIQTVQKLPKTMQLDFIPFVQLATEYVNAQNATEQLILSFERKGE